MHTRLALIARNKILYDINYYSMVCNRAPRNNLMP